MEMIFQMTQEENKEVIISIQKSVEVSAGMEFTFLEFDLHRRSFNFTPYIYTGFSALNHPNFFFGNNELKNEKY